MEGPYLAADRVTRRYPNGLGVFGLSLVIAPGEVVGLLGPNGSGKSTALRVLATLEPPTAGWVRWFGMDHRRCAAVRRRIGVALDLPVHFDRLTGLQNAELFTAQCGVGRWEARERLPRLFDWAGLTDAAHLPVAEYSLGMRRRLSLVEALGHEPDLVLLDEPSLALDTGGEVDLAWQLRRLAGRGAGVLVATNDRRLACRTCDRALRLDHGRPAEAT